MIIQNLPRNWAEYFIDPGFIATELALRARIEREQWHVAIHPAGVEMKGSVVIGSREEAESQARAVINDWLKRHPTQNPKSN